MSQENSKPKYDLAVYRDFVREAAPYVSLITGKKILPSDADLMSEKSLIELALIIDSRVGDLNKSKPPGN